MAISVNQLADSPRVFTSYGERPWAERRYTVIGTDDKDEARSAVAAEAEDLFDLFGNGIFFLPRAAIFVESVDDEVWDATVRYEVTPQTNQSEHTFDTRGGMQHLTHALQHIASYPSGIAPDHKGTIGVTPSGIEGIDIPVRNFHFAERHYFGDSVVTDAYIDLLYSLTGTVNNALFKRRALGECLFLGASGSKRGGGDWAVDFEFANSPNRTGVTIGDITGISKKGWEYLWVEYRETVDDVAKSIVQRPIAVHIEQVFFYGDLSLLGIGT